LLGDHADDVLGAAHPVPVDGDDQVAAGTEEDAPEILLAPAPAQAGFGRRTALNDSLYRPPALFCKVEMGGELRRHGLRRHAEPGVANTTAVDQLLHRALRRVDRNSE